MLVVKNRDGFTVIEVLIALTVVALLVGLISSVVNNTVQSNRRADRRSDAGSLAYKKIQDYLNLDFASVPIGDGATSYEVEDFSVEAENTYNLTNASAKVYVEPASQITSQSITNQYNEVISADTEFANGAEIATLAVNNASSWFFPQRIADDNYSNYGYRVGAGNVPSPSIDLGSPVVVDTLRVNWFVCGYGSNNFRVEAKNGNPNSNSGWTTITGGLSDNGIPCSFGSNPQDIAVAPNTTPYQHWRLFFVTLESSMFAVVSELEAFAPSTPGDTVEQNGADASLNPGQLDFDDDSLEMSQNGTNGQQSVGMIFDDIQTVQGATIENARLQFTADQADSGVVTLLVRGINTDMPNSWVGPFAVDAAVDADNSDGQVGTIATVDWTPPPWTAGEFGDDTAVDITAIIQEIVDRPGWSPGNAIGLSVQYSSGSSRRVASRTPAPQLVIDWSETISSASGGYVDTDMDGDVDNPTLLKIYSIIEYEVTGETQRIEYVTFIREFGLVD